MKTGGNNPDKRQIWSLSYKTNFNCTPFFKSSSGWRTRELNPRGCRICFSLIALSGYLIRWQMTKTPPFTDKLSLSLSLSLSPFFLSLSLSLADTQCFLCLPTLSYTSRRVSHTFLRFLLPPFPPQKQPQLTFCQVLVGVKLFHFPHGTNNQLIYRTSLIYLKEKEVNIKMASHFLCLFWFCVLKRRQSTADVKMTLVGYMSCLQQLSPSGSF